MPKIKKGIHGMTRMRNENVLGSVIICDGRFANIKGEIIGERNDHMKYLTIQVPSEYKDRVYIVNLLHSQCKNIYWRHQKDDNMEID